MFELPGYAAPIDTLGSRTVTASVHFKADAHGPYAWLNHLVVVHEGHITEEGTTCFPT